MINFEIFLAGGYMAFSPAALLFGIFLCSKKKKENNPASTVKPQQPIQTVIVGDRKEDCGEDDPDLASRIQPNEATPAGCANQPADAPLDNTGELLSIINSVAAPAAAVSSKKKDNSAASTLLLSISKQLCMPLNEVKALARKDEHTQRISEGGQRSKQVVYVTQSSKLQSKELIREQEKTQNTDSEHKQLDEQSTPLSSGIIPVENTPPSTVPSLKVDRTNDASENAHGTRSILRNSTHSSRQLLSQSSASSAKDHVREKSNSKSKRFPTTNADDVRPKLDRTQGDSTASSGDDEGKQPTGSNVNNKDERTAGIANAKGVKNQRFLKKSRGSSQNGGEAIPNDDINAKDGNGQEVVEGNFQVDETEGAEMSSRLTGPQSDGNMRSGHSSGMSTKKTKANKSDDQHKGVSSRRNMSTRRKRRSEVTTESESRKFGGSLETVERRDRKEGQRGCDAKSSEHHPRSSNDERIAERRTNVEASSLSNRSERVDTMQHSNPRSCKLEVSKQMDAAVQSDSDPKQMLNCATNNPMNDNPPRMRVDTTIPSTELGAYRPNGEGSQKMSAAKSQGSSGPASPPE